MSVILFYWDHLKSCVYLCKVQIDWKLRRYEIHFCPRGPAESQCSAWTQLLKAEMEPAPERAPKGEINFPLFKTKSWWFLAHRQGVRMFWHTDKDNFRRTFISVSSLVKNQFEQGTWALSQSGTASPRCFKWKRQWGHGSFSHLPLELARYGRRAFFKVMADITCQFLSWKTVCACVLQNTHPMATQANNNHKYLLPPSYSSMNFDLPSST